MCTEMGRGMHKDGLGGLGGGWAEAPLLTAAGLLQSHPAPPCPWLWKK